jgi:hypothetical protein
MRQVLQDEQHQCLSNFPSLSSSRLQLKCAEGLPADVIYPTCKEETWQRCQRYALILLKVIIFPWGIYEISCFVLQRLLMIPLYPVQSNFLSLFLPIYRKSHFEDLREASHSIASTSTSSNVDPSNLRTRRMSRQFSYAQGNKKKMTEDTICRHMIFQSPSGYRLSGFWYANPETFQKKEVVIYAPPNGNPMELTSPYIANQSQEVRKMYLSVNSPGVAASEGRAHPKTMRESPEVAYAFAKLMGFKKITFIGHSMGCVSLAEMFNKMISSQQGPDDDMEITVIWEVGFSSISEVVRGFIHDHFSSYLSWLGPFLIRRAGLQSSVFEAVEQIDQLNKTRKNKIHQHFVQGGIGECTVGGMEPTVQVLEKNEAADMTLSQREQQSITKAVPVKDLLCSDGLVAKTATLAWNVLKKGLDPHHTFHFFTKLPSEDSEVNLHNSDRLSHKRLEILKSLQNKELK